MSRKTKMTGRGLVWLILFGILASTAAYGAQTTIEHDPIPYFVAEKRIEVEAEVSDKAGIALVRCYFRAKGLADFVFVPMKMWNKDEYRGIIPAPSPGTAALEYLFLAVNMNNQVVKTETFSVNIRKDKKTPAWQQTGSTEKLTVKTELPQAPRELAGFKDSVTIDVVESSARFGLVAGGIYAATELGASGGAAGAAAGTAGTGGAGVSGAAAAATSAGTVTAAAGGMSAAAVIGVGAGIAAVAGAGVVIADEIDDEEDEIEDHHTNGGNGNEAALVKQNDGSIVNTTGQDINVSKVEIIFENFVTYIYDQNDAASADEIMSSLRSAGYRDNGVDIIYDYTTPFVIPANSSSEILASYQQSAQETNASFADMGVNITLVYNIYTDAGTFSFR